MSDRYVIGGVAKFVPSLDGHETVVFNAGGGTLYYKTTSNVSSTVKDGSIAVGSSFSFTGEGRWFRASAPNVTAIVETTPTSTTDMATQAELEAYEVKEAQLPSSVVIDSIKKYGATGDGVTDDTASFNLALKSGGRIHVPAGNYRLPSVLAVAASVQLDMASDALLDFSEIAAGSQNANNAVSFAGSEETAVNLTANAEEHATTLSVASTTGFAAGDWVRVGSNAYFTPSPTAFHYKIGEFAKIASVTPTKITLDAKLAEGPYNTADIARVSKVNFADRIIIRGGKIRGPGTGHEATAMLFDKCSNVKVEGVSLEDFDYKDIDFLDCIDASADEIRVDGGSSASTGFYGVTFSGATQDSRFTNSYVYSCRHACTTDFEGGLGIPRRLVVANNTFNRQIATAVDSHACGEDIAITGNTILNPVDHGISSRSPKTTITGNVIRGAGGVGIWCRNQSDRPSEYTVTGNKIVGCGSYGIYYRNPPEAELAETDAGEAISGVAISGNVVSECAPSEPWQIYCGSEASFPLKRIAITGNVMHGGGLRLDNVTDSQVTANHIADVSPSAAAAIYLLAVSDTSISGNTISFEESTAVIGIRARTTSARLLIAGNRVKNGGTGVSLENTVNESTVRDNSLSECTTEYVRGTGSGNNFRQNSDDGVFSVLDFGAVGDGSANDTAALQAAVTAASGKELAFPGGLTYKVTEKLLLPSGGITLNLGLSKLNFASAASSTVFLEALGTQATSEESGYAALSAEATEGATSVTVETGQEAEFAAGDYVKVASSATYDPLRTASKIGEIAIVDSTESGKLKLKSPLSGGPYKTEDSAFVAKLNLVGRTVIKGGEILGGGASSAHQAIVLTRCNAPIVEGTKIDKAEVSGVVATDCIAPRIRFCAIERATKSTTGYGVDLGDATQDGLVFGCHFRECRHATTTGHSTSGFGIPRRNTVQSNTCWDTVSTGDAFDTHAATEDIRYLDNIVYDSAGQGFNIECAVATVSGNEVWRSASHGIAFHNETAYPTSYECVGNVVKNPGSSHNCIRCVSVSSGAGSTVRRVKIHDNSCRGAGTQAINVSSTAEWRFNTVSIKDNVIGGSLGTNPCIDLIKADGCNVSGNTISGVLESGSGIHLSDVTKTPCGCNEISCSSATASLGVNCATMVDCTLVGNTVTGASKGINYASSCTNNIASANNLRGCTTPVAGSTGADNQFFGNEPGVLATVASAESIALPASENGVYNISGTTEIKKITAVNGPGRIVVLKFASELTVKDGENLKLKEDFKPNADDTLTLYCDGTNYREIARSAN